MPNRPAYGLPDENISQGRNVSRQSFLPLIAMVIGLILIAMGCSDQPAVRARYEAERELFNAERQFESLRIRPDLNNTEEIRKLRQTYRDLITHCAESRTQLAAAGMTEENPDFRQLNEITYRASTRLSQFYFSDRLYDSAAALLSPFVNDIPIPSADRIVASYNVGRALQSAGKWDEAATTFRTMLGLIEKSYAPIDTAIRRDAPLFEQAFRILVTFSEFSRQFGTPNPFTLNESVEFYQRMISIDPTSRLAEFARAHIARLYEVAEQWESAITALGQITDSTGSQSLSGKLRIADIEATNLGKYDDAIAHYTELEAGLRGTDTLILPELRYRRVAVLINKKDYELAATQLVALERNFPAYYNSKAPAQQAKARLFELQGKRDRAESEYRFLIEKYPNSGEAMSTFLHLAQVYAQSGDTASSRNWYDKAERHYEQVAARGAGTILEALAMNFRAELYRQKEDWPRAATALEEIYRRFPNETMGRESVVKAASIYALKLNDTVKAGIIMEELRRAMSPVDVSQ